MKLRRKQLDKITRYTSRHTTNREQQKNFNSQPENGMC